MQKLLKALTEQGLLHEWEDTDFDLPYLLRAVALMRHGALAAGIWDLRRVSKWQTRHLTLLKACLSEGLILNAFAEDYHNAFPWEQKKSLDLMWGALLGDKIGQVYNYHKQHAAFYTRVVGLKHSLLPEQEISNLTPGTFIIVVPECNNPVDPNAIAVLNPNGVKIGYLRKPLAEVITLRLAAGNQAIAKIAHVLPKEFHPDSRVNIKVQFLPESTTFVKMISKETITIQITEKKWIAVKH